LDLMEPQQTTAERNEAQAGYDFWQSVNKPVRSGSAARRIGRPIVCHGM